MNFGGGGFKANIGIFGADQLLMLSDPCVESTNGPIPIDISITQNQKTPPEMINSLLTFSETEMSSPKVNAGAIASYWNWFYLAINGGALIGYALIAYLCQNISFFVGWSVSTIAMFIAIVLFMVRIHNYYTPRKDVDKCSSGSEFFAVTWYAISHRKRRELILQRIAEHQMVKSVNSINTYTASSTDCKKMVGTLCTLQYTELNAIDSFRFHWLDVAKLRYNGQYDDNLVDEIKSLYSVFGFLPFAMIYWIVYAAENSLFFFQGCQMNYNICTSFDFPIASLCDAGIIAIFVLVPIMDRIYPWINGPNGCCKCKFGMLKKMGVGYFILAVAMVCAGCVEMWRKSAPTLDQTSTCDSSIYVSNLSVLWQIPQYVLVGVSEVFASIPSLEFFSGQAPESMKSIVYALNLVMRGTGILVQSQMVLVVNLWRPHWITDNLDDGYLEYYYFSSAGALIVMLLVYIPYATSYEYKKGTDVSNMHAHVQPEADLATRARIVSESLQ